MKGIKVEEKEDCPNYMDGDCVLGAGVCHACSGPDSKDCPLESLSLEGDGEFCLWPNGVPGFPAHRLPKCHPSYKPLKCSACKKEIDEDNCVAVTKKGKTKYYCSGICWGNAIDASSH
jgi:hypothetical protein